MPSYAEQAHEMIDHLFSCQRDLKDSNDHYEAKHRVSAVGVSTPKQMEDLTASIGWSRMYLDAIEERMDLEGFRLPNDDENTKVKRLLQWWQDNNLDEYSGMAHLDAMIYGRSYITVSGPGPGDPADSPVIRVESPVNFYASIDPRTGEVTRAVRLFTNPENADQQWATLYLPNETIHLVHSGGHWTVDSFRPGHKHNLGLVPVVPMLNRERLTDRDGRSEITPELRSFTDAAARTMMNMQAAAEMMALPQRLLFGIDSAQIAPNGSPQEVFNAYMANIMAIGNSDARAEQFEAAELMNYVNVLQEIAKHVASYTGLPPQYLSFSSENPASAEAIKSSEARLVKKCERKARMFGGAWERVMRLALRVMDGSVPEDYNRLQAVWADPSTPTYSAKADGAQKLYNGGNGVIPKKRARVDMGYTDVEIEQMEDWDEEEKQELKTLADAVSSRRAAQGPPVGDPAVPSNENPRQDRAEQPVE